MSKSEESDYSRINMTDDAETIRQKIRKAKTDPLPLPADKSELDARPEAANLLGIYAALSGESLEQSVARFAGTEFSKFKEALSELLIAVLGPIEAERARLMAEPGYIDGVLRRGAERAMAIAGRCWPRPTIWSACYARKGNSKPSPVWRCRVHTRATGSASIP